MAVVEEPNSIVEEEEGNKNCRGPKYYCGGGGGKIK